MLPQSPARAALRTELAWLDEDRPCRWLPGGWRCADCGTTAHTTSIVDPTRCGGCARRRYAWRSAPFDRYRRVPPAEAAHWE